MKWKVDRDKIERADRESKILLDAERAARESKTANLREQRLKAGSTEPNLASDLKPR
ncbi:hypothetical protein MesoLj113c_40340 [Mesorhizobium sp. 113-3-9]|uniref:hypothetical protein n=1 Tax=Mesorhizobium sp. 113-3-9 TaxID=2744517 RepID=UPI0019285E30|nr:hypothetical protein [Mesorhizobium sp. 113-3-9]BCG87924.1 hypothetical protein MesoLj113c_40340 [Mesorhizobium sp. 113-3-9]